MPFLNTRFQLFRHLLRTFWLCLLSLSFSNNSGKEYKYLEKNTYTFRVHNACFCFFAMGFYVKTKSEATPNNIQNWSMTWKNFHSQLIFIIKCLSKGMNQAIIKMNDKGKDNWILLYSCDIFSEETFSFWIISTTILLLLFASSKEVLFSVHLNNYNSIWICFRQRHSLKMTEAFVGLFYLLLLWVIESRKHIYTACDWSKVSEKVLRNIKENLRHKKGSIFLQKESKYKVFLPS